MRISTAVAALVLSMCLSVPVQSSAQEYENNKPLLDNECTQNCFKEETNCRSQCASQYSGFPDATAECEARCSQQSGRCITICSRINKVTVLTEQYNPLYEPETPPEKKEPEPQTFFKTGGWGFEGMSEPPDEKSQKMEKSRIEHWRFIWAAPYGKKQRPERRLKQGRQPSKGLQPITRIMEIQP